MFKKNRNILKPIGEVTKDTRKTMNQTIRRVQKGLKNTEVTDTIAKGAVGVAITAGVIAAGAALMNKETRKKVGRTAKIGFDKLSEYAAIMAEEGEGKYQAVQHDLKPVIKSIKKTARSKKFKN